MPSPVHGRLSALCGSAMVMFTAIGAVSCGDDTVSTDEAVQAFNRQVEVREVRLMCPEEVDGASKEFDCQLQGTKTGKTATVKMAPLERESDVLDVADSAAFRNAVAEVTQP